MALKVLLKKKNLEDNKRSLEELQVKFEDLEKREKEAEEAINEINEETTEEEKEAVEQTVDELAKEKENLEAQRDELESKISEIEAEIEEIEEETEEQEERTTLKEVSTRSAKVINTHEEIRGGNFMNIETRERLKRMLAKEENISFYRQVADVVSKRATGFENGAELVVPEDVYYEINQKVGDYGTLYNLVDKINLNGTARVIVNGGEVQMYWTEKCAPLQEVVLGELRQIELDNYKLGGYIFICNAYLEDSAIDLAEYINNEFAKGIAVALDQAIYAGEGPSLNQPEGISKVLTKTETVNDVLGLLGAIGGVNATKGQNASIINEVTLAANRATLYKWIFPETYGKDSNGRLVYGLGNNLPDGTKIVESQVIPDDEILIGDFKSGYKLGVRKDMRFDSNDRIRWIEEETGFKISGRYDGKVARPEAFVRLKFAAPKAPKADA